MPRIQRCKTAQRLAIAALGGAAIMTATAAPALAATAQYGPPPLGTPIPGGYFTVITSRSISQVGGVLGPVLVDGMSVTLRIPRGTFQASTQITITQPNRHGIGNGDHPGYVAMGGVGIIAQTHGTAVTGHFSKPVQLTLRSPRITSANRLVVWDGRSRFLSYPATRSAGKVQFKDTSAIYQDFAALAPGHRAMTVGRAHTIHSGSARTTAASHGPDAAVPALLFAPAGATMPGIGVLAAQRPTVSNR
jgi:hypothetical protein